VNPRVQFEPEADAEYRLAGQWYEGRREHLGIEFFDAVDEAIDRVLAWPQSGSLEPHMPLELPVRRFAVTRFPYRVVYLEVGEQVRILAIAHDRRKPGYWMARLK
jgi:plasmid stabilization system protein ParE